MDCLSARAGSNPVITAEQQMARSSNGSGCETLILAAWVRLPYGLLVSERSEAWLSRQFGELEIVGSNPTVLTA